MWIKGVMCVRNRRTNEFNYIPLRTDIQVDDWTDAI